jgi:hypothetical protein
MITEYTIILILFLHFVSDFVLQSRDMGRKKGKNLYWLTTHVFVYSLSFTFLWFLLTKPLNNPYNEVIMFFSLVFSTHWITDYFTSKLSGGFYLKMNESKSVKTKNFYEWLFWLIIGFDQFIHIASLILIAKYI